TIATRGRPAPRTTSRLTSSAVTDFIACISSVTAEDVKRLVVRGAGLPRVAIVPLGLNYPYRKLSPTEAHQRLAQISQLDLTVPFVLHVGTNTPRKNRDGVLRIFA